MCFFGQNYGESPIIFVVISVWLNMPNTRKALDKTGNKRGRVRKSERREQILLELKLHPHVRISELAEKFSVSTETVRRDFDKLAADGLISRAFGGASAPSVGFYPNLDERTVSYQHERERIGMAAAQLIGAGDTVMIDSGSTTIQMARSLAYLGTNCTVVTNSLPVAMTLGQGAAKVVICPGDYLAAESAVIGTDTIEFLGQFNVDHCMIGASGLSPDGVSETVSGFAAVKRAMLRRAKGRHLLIGSHKFGTTGLVNVGSLGALDTIISDALPDDPLLAAIRHERVEIIEA